MKKQRRESFKILRRGSHTRDNGSVGEATEARWSVLVERFRRVVVSSLLPELRLSLAGAGFPFGACFAAPKKVVHISLARSLTVQDP